MPKTTVPEDRTSAVCRFIVKCAKGMTRADFDGMMHLDGNTVSVPFSERACYRFGKTTVSPEFIDAVFADPEYYEKMFENA